MSTIIKPTVGRIVWFHPVQPSDGLEEVHAAIVTHVHSDTCVNLAIFDANGEPYSRTSVTLINDDFRIDQIPASGFAEWMPYQKGQAAKTEALERQVGEARP